MNVKELIERRDKVNFQIKMLENENMQKRLKKDEIIKDLLELGVHVTDDNLEELFEKYTKEYEEAVIKLGEVVSSHETILKELGV